MHLLYIAVFGVLGCLSRFLASDRLCAWAGKGLPFGTLAINVIGSFFFGLIMDGGMVTLETVRVFRHRKEDMSCCGK
jgi:CrcB protein